MSKEFTMSIKHLRGLLKKQKGRCAISNIKLTPDTLTADHIIPFADKSKANIQISSNENVWLVHKEVNRMKGSTSYDDLIKFCKSIISNEKKSRKLWKEIKEGKVEMMPLSDFQVYIDKYYDQETETIKIPN